ncbi:MAG: hypothetical protein C4318_00900 [Acidimicrobiia bacterium]
MEADKSKRSGREVAAETSPTADTGSFPRIPEWRARRSKRRPFNPSGKEALFSVADAGAARRISGAAVADAIEAGRGALFCLDRRRIGTVLVECSSCGRSSRISWLELVLARLPVSFWVPFRSYDHFMRCPSCSKMTWLSVSFFK